MPKPLRVVMDQCHAIADWWEKLLDGGKDQPGTKRKGWDIIGTLKFGGALIVAMETYRYFAHEPKDKRREREQNEIERIRNERRYIREAVSASLERGSDGVAAAAADAKAREETGAATDP